MNSAAVPSDYVYDNPYFPEFQWISEHRGMEATLNPGDVVLFERGGVWRGALRCAPGVTYSAYGNGPKPSIYGSPEDGATGDRWSLVPGTDNVWKYYQDMQDLGGILLNGSTIAHKHIAYWDGNRYINVPGQYIYYSYTCSLEEYSKMQTMTSADLGNLEFFSDIDRTSGFNNAAKGPLYLRCDAGNPGDVYDSIEFIGGSENEWGWTAVSLRDGSNVDNLDVRYSAIGGIACEQNNTVRNCTVSWCGGIDQGSNVDLSSGSAYIQTHRCGNGINCTGSYNTIENNYVYEIFDFGCIVEAFTEDSEDRYEQRVFLHDNTIRNNVLDRCNGGIGVADYYARDNLIRNDHFANIVVEDNQVFDTGMGVLNTPLVSSEDITTDTHFTYGVVAGLLVQAIPDSTNIQVRRNVICNSHEAGQLVALLSYDDRYDIATFTDNVYAQQYPGLILYETHSSLENPQELWSNRYVYNDSRVNESILTIPGASGQTIISPWSPK